MPTSTGLGCAGVGCWLGRDRRCPDCCPVDRNCGRCTPFIRYAETRVLARLSLLAACVFVVSGSSASASSSGVLRLHLHRLPYTVDSYPMASGDYVLLSLSQAVGHYVVFDDKTHHRTVLSPPDNCSMWGSAPFSATEATLDRARPGR